MSVTFFISALMKAFVFPPGGNILAIFFGLLIRRRHPFMGVALVLLSVLGLTAFSLPIVSNAMMVGLAQHKALNIEQAKKGEAIVLLTGGVYAKAPEYGRDTINSTSLFRARYAAYLHKRTDLPLAVIGGRLPDYTRSEAGTVIEALRDDFHIEVKWREETDCARDPFTAHAACGIGVYA